MPRPEHIGGTVFCDPGETHENYYMSSRRRVDRTRFRGSVSAIPVRHERVTRVISTMETGPDARAIPGGVGVSALGSKVRDYNIPGMPFRVHQFGTPVPSLRSSLFTTPRARARVFSPCCPSSLPSRRAMRSVPDEREAPWKCITLVTLPPRSYSCSRERACGLILSRKDPLSGNR